MGKGFRLVGIVVAAVMVLLAPMVKAGTEGIAVICERTDSICFWHRPKLDAPQGWQRDEGASQEVQANVFVPAGATFEAAPAVIYGRAIPREGQVASLSAFVDDDVATFEQHYVSLQVQRGLAIADGDGTSLTAVRLSPVPGSDAQWETVAYAEEGDYYLIFVLSARNKSAHDADLPVFEHLLAGYRAGPPDPKDRYTIIPSAP